MVKDLGHENLICSPYSVWLPLAALVNAAEEPAKAQLLEVLAAAGIGEGDLNRAAARMLFDLTNQESQLMAQEYGEAYAYDPLKIANAIFVGKDLTLSPDFSQAFADFYRGSATVG